MKAPEIRGKFKKYFADRGHNIVPSSPLIPRGDETILFSNAGMNQFKDVFLGIRERSYPRAVSCQKCMRVSGKHNDLENVGYTARHHTFFEMLGNFSFGDYFKNDAIAYGWDFLTAEMGLPADKLWVTVFEEDSEAFDIWKGMNVLPESRIVRMGEKDNFWAMGETGPCGPCSEIHIDLGEDAGCGKADCSVGCDCDRFLEIWNLVFMEFMRNENGTMTSLPSPSIDTGMGLERITAAVQGVKSNYETDLFQPVIKKVEELSGLKYNSSPEIKASMNVIADHVRAFLFLVSDGVIPSNEGRGYVLRKITRRAIRFAKKLDIGSPFMEKLIPVVTEMMVSEYPELRASSDMVSEISRIEEEKFDNTLSSGLKLLEDLCGEYRGSGRDTLPGAEVFKLYDTYGFPLDLTVDIARDYGLLVDSDGYGTELEKQRELARKSWKGASKQLDTFHDELASKIKCVFTGYDTLVSEKSSVKIVLKDGKQVSSLNEGEEGGIVLDVTPFYGESGGQVGDRGFLSSPNMLAEVTDTTLPVKGLTVHSVKVVKGVVRPEDVIRAEVDQRGRQRIKAHHTTTHLLHKALRAELGDHIKQAGSMVSPDRFRFDFTHYRILSSESVRRIEDDINSRIRENMPVITEVLPLDKALETGAVALFGENYGDTVRVISIGDYSRELCGGTHCSMTGEIGLFRIVSEKSVASGVRRIEAVCGEPAYDLFRNETGTLRSIASGLNCPPEKCGERVSELQEMNVSLQKELAAFRMKLAQSGSGSKDDTIEIKGVKAVIRKTEGLGVNEIRNLSDSIKNRLGSGVIVLGSGEGGKVTLMVSVTSDLTDRLDASIIVKDIAGITGGSGGGKKEMAQAGGKDPSKLDEALEKSAGIIGSYLN